MKSIAFDALQLMTAYYKILRVAHYWGIAANYPDLAAAEKVAAWLFASVDTAADLITLAQNARDAAQRDCYADRDYMNAPAYYVATATQEVEEIDAPGVDDPRPIIVLKQQRVELLNCEELPRARKNTGQK